MTHAECSISRIILYVKDFDKVTEFYRNYFGFTPVPGNEDGWLELAPPNGVGCYLALHQASKAQKPGSEIKLAFYVTNIEEFLQQHQSDAQTFGTVHEFRGIRFSNGKDPAGNSIQISSRKNAPLGQ